MRNYVNHNNIIFNGIVTEKCFITYLKTRVALQWIIDLGDKYHIEVISTTNKIFDISNCLVGIVLGIDSHFAKCHLYFSKKHLETIDVTGCNLYGHLLSITPLHLLNNCPHNQSFIEHVPLCGLQVFGTPVIDVNCSNCLQSVSSPCGNSVWCEQCAPGFRPPDCKRTCQTGYFGVNCLQTYIVPNTNSSYKQVTCNITGEVEEESTYTERNSSLQSIPIQTMGQGTTVGEMKTYILAGSVVILAIVCIALAIVLGKNQAIIARRTGQHRQKRNQASSKLQSQTTLLEEYENASIVEGIELTSVTSSGMQQDTEPSNPLYINVVTVNAGNSNSNSDNNTEGQNNRSKEGGQIVYSGLRQVTIDEPGPSIYQALSRA